MKLLNILILLTAVIISSHGEELKYPERCRDKTPGRVYIIGDKELSGFARDLEPALSGFDVEFVEAAEAVKSRAGGLKEKYKKASVILVGGLENNQAAIQLYARFMTNADALTPGGTGMMIQQIPGGNIPGGNAVVIAGGTPDSTREAVKKYIAELKNGKHPFDVQLYDFKSGIATKYRKDMIRLAARCMKPENSWRNFYHLAEAHRLTGEQKYVDAVRASAEKMQLIKDNHYGMGLVIRGWDYWARSGLLGGELTRKVDQLFMDYLAEECDSWWRRRENKAVFSDNRHHVYGTWGYYQTALMLYRGLDENQRGTAAGRFIKSRIDECEQWFSACCREYVPSVLSTGVFINLNIFALYSLQSGNTELFESGRAAEYVKLAVAATDNTGCSVGISGYEDTYPGAWLAGYPVGGVINIAAYVYRSGQYAWLKKHLPGFSNDTWWLLSSDNHSYAADIRPEPASDMLGFMPVFDRKGYPLYVGFRTGFAPDDLAFCITGSGTDDINTGDSGKGRQVYPNMIPRLSWQGVSWLVQNTNFVTPGYRNALTVDTSGGDSRIMNDMKTVFSGHDNGTYFYSGLAEKYCGSDWTRSFIVVGNDFMLVEDRVCTSDAGSAAGTVTWRTPYAAELTDYNRVTAFFNGRQLNFQAVSPQPLAVNIEYSGKQGSLSPYVIRQSFSESLNTSGAIAVANLLYPGEPNYAVRLVKPQVYAVRDKRDNSVSLLGFGEFSGGGLMVNGKVFRVGASGWSALDGKLSVNGQTYHGQQLPLNLKYILDKIWENAGDKTASEKVGNAAAPEQLWRFADFAKCFPLLTGYEFAAAGAANPAMAFDGNIKRYKRASWNRGRKLDVTVTFPDKVNLRQVAMLYYSDGGRKKLYRKLPDKVGEVKIMNLDPEPDCEAKTEIVPYFELDETYKGVPFTYTGALASTDVSGKTFRIQADAASLYQMRLYGGAPVLPEIVDALVYGKDKLLVRNAKDEIACLNITDGKCLWQMQAPFKIMSWTAGKENIALGCMDSTVKGLDPATGKISWSCDTSGIPLGMPYSIAPLNDGFIVSSYYHMNPVGPDGRLHCSEQKTLPGMWLYDVMGNVELNGDGVPDAISRALWGHVNLYDGKTGKVDYFANLRGRLVAWQLFKGRDSKPDLLIVSRDGIGLYDAHIRNELLHEGWDGAPDEDALLIEKRSQREIWSRKFNSEIKAFACLGDELILGFGSGMLRRFTLSGKELGTVFSGGPILDIHAVGEMLLVNSGRQLRVYDRNCKLQACYLLENTGIRVFEDGKYIIAFTSNGVLRLSI